MIPDVAPARVDREELRCQVSFKYTEVALEPEKGFHFHTGRPLAMTLGYAAADVDWLPPATVDSFAGTGNPFTMGALTQGAVVLEVLYQFPLKRLGDAGRHGGRPLRRGGRLCPPRPGCFSNAPNSTVLEVGCGAGFDTLLAARQVGPRGKVIAVDMTGAMVDKTRQSVAALGLDNVDVRLGHAEELPAKSGSVDVVISNGAINLCPDKMAVMHEVHRVLRPSGRFQIADIVVHREVPQEAKDDIQLWSG